MSACGVRPEHHRAQPCAIASGQEENIHPIFTRHEPDRTQIALATQRCARQCDCTASKTRVRPGEPPLVSPDGRHIVSAHFSNSSLADARRRLCGAASNSATAGPLLASLSKRRVASVFRLRLLGEARATRSVLHVSRCWTSLNEMGRLSTRCGDADGGSRRLRLAPTGTGACK